MKKNLLIDIGNSDVKIGEAYPKNHNVKLLKRFSYSKDNFEKDFSKHFPKSIIKTGYNKAGISVLNENRTDFLTDFLKHNIIFINRKMKLPVKMDYTTSLGNDRICNAAATCFFNKKNILVIDFGTATTYTLVSEKILTGGIISPGIGTSLSSLISKTLLPDVKLHFPRNLINNDTIKNIQSGVLYQCLFTVERVIHELKKKYNNLYVISTGGYSELISEKTKSIDIVDRYMVLKGINLIISQ